MQNNRNGGQRGRPRNPLNDTDPYTNLATRRSTALALRLLASEEGLTQDDMLRKLLGMDIRDPAYGDYELETSPI